MSTETRPPLSRKDNKLFLPRENVVIQNDPFYMPPEDLHSLTPRELLVQVLQGYVGRFGRDALHDPRIFAEFTTNPGCRYFPSEMVRFKSRGDSNDSKIFQPITTDFSALRNMKPSELMLIRMTRLVRASRKGHIDVHGFHAGIKRTSGQIIV